MLFLPYKIDINLARVPFVTLIIMVICLLIFNKQVDSNQKYNKAMDHYCNESLSRQLIILVNKLDFNHIGCGAFWESIRSSKDPQATLLNLTNTSNGFFSDHQVSKQVQQEYDSIYQEYQYFLKMVPYDLTNQLQYEPENFNLFKMITSSFSHISWMHVIGNLIFFYVFAAAIEIITGSVVFLGIVILMSITTSMAYSLSVFGDEYTLPSVGLSGVVMGMMAMLAILVPKVRIKCFFWFIILFKTFRIPALFLAVWYIGWDFYDMKNERGSGVNYIAHVSGAITGIIIAFVYMLAKPKFIRKIRL